MGPIALVARRQYRRGLDAVERADFDALLPQFSANCTLTFVGDTPLGAQLRGHGDIRRWFDRFARMLPQPRFEIQKLAITGPPWRQHLAAHVHIRSTVAGQPYQNQFAHFLTIKWGKVTDDLILEDTQTWAHACERLAESGMAEALSAPLTPAVSSPLG
jgi:ketosteroid isomerase-like protein